MPRPLKWRNVSSLPENDKFGPVNCCHKDREEVNMTVDEYETIKLIDLLGMNQEECAAQMGIARATVQGIYVKARKKLAECLVEGKLLLISGGEYKLCGGKGHCCNHHDGDNHCCGKKCCQKEAENNI